MAFLLGDSFDFYAAAADYVTIGKWSGSHDTGALTSPSTRFSFGRAHFPRNVNLQKNFAATSSNTVYIALSVFMTTGATDGAYVQLIDGSSAQVTIRFESNGDITVRSAGVSGTLLGTYSSAYAVNAWNHFVIKVVIHNTTGSVSIRKNGNTSDDYTLTGVNTRGGTASTQATRLGLKNISGTGSASCGMDDLLVFDDSGAAPNTWCGDVRCYTLYPSADTADADFSPSTGSDRYANVDDSSYDGDSTFNSSGTVNDEDFYELQNLPTTPTSIIAVQARSVVRKSDSGSRSAQMGIKSGATTDYHASTALGTTYDSQIKTYVTDPDTAAAWTASGVNALKIGMKVSA
jgi:hypothetical protein